jgi:cobalamin biosynthesis protein CbiD
MRFKEYLIKEHIESQLSEELFVGGLNKMIKRLEFWFDLGGKKGTEEKIEQLETELVNAGGPNKFAMIVRRVPAVKHFLRKHIDDLSGELLQTAKLI